MNNNVVLVLISLSLLLVIFTLCRSNSKFQKSENRIGSTPAGIPDDVVIIFFAPWCGHCKKAKGEFEKAQRYGNGKVMLVDATLPENKDLVQKHNVKGFPTIVKGNKTHNGPRTEKEILKFANKA